MTNKFPRLRSHVRRRKSGRVVTYYSYDRRPEGEPDIALGTDYDTALKRWDEIHNKAPRIAGTLEEAFAAWERDVLPGYTSAETRKGYARHLSKLRPVFGHATWDTVTLPTLKGYLKKRTAKTQGNREMALLSIVWNWARVEGITALHWPAAGMERSRWKNPEQAREVEVTDAMFDSVYAQGDLTLRACMDISTATALRLTDCRTVAMPRAGVLSGRESKRGKPFRFAVDESPVLQAILAARTAVPNANHTMLLSTPDGKKVTARMLRDRWAEARAAAIKTAREAGDDELVASLTGLFLRDMRKRASNLAESDEEARELLGHDDVALTTKHYRTVVKLKRTVR